MIEINSLWIGDELSDMEILAINSHILVGHKYNLWCYSEIKNIPNNVNICDANQLMSKKDIFYYQKGEGKGSPSAFSNIFRYKFLLQKGGWWADTDVVAIKAFDFDEEYVFATEQMKNGDIFPTTCVIKAPSNSKLFEDCLYFANLYDKNTLEWSTIGPHLLSKCLNNHKDLKYYLKNFDIFCPISWFEINKDLTLSRDVDLSLSYGVHLWNEMWRRLSINKNDKFNKDTFYEKLRSNYLCPHPQNGRDKRGVGTRSAETASLFCKKTHKHQTGLVRML